MESSESELPDDIIYHIITKHLFCDPTLTNRAAVRLSLVSKEFSRALQSRRALVFEWENDPGSKNRCLQELKYMVSALKTDSGHHLETFTIRAARRWFYDFISNSIYHDDYSSFDRCIELAATNPRGLKNLNLHFWDTYVLPQHVFHAKSLVRLHIRGGCIPATGSAITWPNLKRLRLDSVSIKDEVLFENIIRGCPVIEILEIIFCSFHFYTLHFKVSNLYHLKQLDIGLSLSQTFEMDALPNLECLVYKHGLGYRHQVDLGKYVYRNLRRLTVSRPKAFNHDFFTDMEHQFPQLEELCIKDTNPSIIRISVSSSSLKKINLQRIKGLEEATFNVPNILGFDFDGNTVPKLSFAGNSGGWVSRLTFKINNANIDTPLFLKLKQFLTAYAIHRTSITVIFDVEVTDFRIVAHPQTSTDVVSIPGTIQGLTICRSRVLRTLCLLFSSKILDGIFLFCRPRRISVQKWPDCKFPKLLYYYLLGSKRNLTEIDVHRLGYDISFQALKQPQILDRDTFLKLINVQGNIHHWWFPRLNVGFELEY